MILGITTFVKNFEKLIESPIIPGFIKTIDKRPTDSPTTYHLPTKPPTTYPSSHRPATINLPELDKLRARCNILIIFAHLMMSKLIYLLTAKHLINWLH